MADKELSDDELLELIEGDEFTPAPQKVRVEGASGTEFTVFGDEEQRWFEMNRDRYLEEYKFENIADLQDLDRLLAMELLSYRYASWLIQGSDYDGLQFDEKFVRDHKQKMDQEIRLTKQHMGMNRKARVESEQQSVAEYLSSLLRRAEEFGIHRDEQVNKAFDLLQEIIKLVGLHYRTDEEEQNHLGVAPHQILAWIRDTAIPEFNAVDDAFRKNQRIWISDISR